MPHQTAWLRLEGFMPHDVMRLVDLNLFLLPAAQRAELYREAEDAGLLIGIPERIHPIQDPLVLWNENSHAKSMWCRSIAADPASAERDRIVACYAYHVWRE